jgi:Fe-S cluster biogenesis protein NfuA
MTAPVNIISAKVPNPLALKFDIEGMALTEGEWNFRSKQEAQGISPLAELLLDLGFVEQVFIAGNFVTVTKRGEDPDWLEVMGMIRILIKKHLDAGNPAVLVAPKEQVLLGLSHDERKIRDLFDNRIRPATMQDGGDIVFDSFADGVVKVKLKGACTGCPYSPRTIKSGIEVILKQQLPGVVLEVTSDDVDWSDTQQD